MVSGNGNSTFHVPPPRPTYPPSPQPQQQSMNILSTNNNSNIIEVDLNNSPKHIEPEIDLLNLSRKPEEIDDQLKQQPHSTKVPSFDLLGGFESTETTELPDILGNTTIPAQSSGLDDIFSSINNSNNHGNVGSEFNGFNLGFDAFSGNNDSNNRNNISNTNINNNINNINNDDDHEDDVDDDNNKNINNNYNNSKYTEFNNNIDPLGGGNTNTIPIQPTTTYSTSQQPSKDNSPQQQTQVN